jgi:AGCS family alanine or glycine:cation symporter
MFAICGSVTALIGTGNMFQSQSMALAVREQFGTPPWLTGLVVSTLVGLVILGGIRRIGAVAERLVPIMILFYFAGALLVILNHLDQVPRALWLIISSAFSPQAALGGAVGIGIQQAIRFGVARGILSNESGLGSAAIAHGAAKTGDPMTQGGIAMMGTFIDTIIVCTMTALTITLSGAYRGASFMVDGIGLSGADLTVAAFNTGMPEAIAGWGGTIVALSSLVFGFTTLIGWSYYGQICLEFLFGLKVVRLYRISFVILLFLGALLTGQYAPIITNLGDICNASMAFPNLIALILLSGHVARVTRERTA